MTTQGQINQWAKGQAGLATLKPSAQELGMLYNYAKEHPGTSSAVLTELLASYRQQAAQGNPLGSPLVPATKGAQPPLTDTSPTASPTAPGAKAAAAASTAAVAAAGSAQPATAGGVGNSALATAGAKLGLTPAQIAQITAGSGSSSSSPALDQFDATTPVYIQSPVVSAPNAGLPGATRTRLSPGDQLATGTGDTTGGPQQSNYQSVISGIYKMDATSLKALKQQLWAGGYYPAGTDPSIVNSTVPDVPTRNAYVTAVQQAARLAEAGHTTTVQEVIALGNPDPQKNTGASANGPYTITSPVDLEQALQSAAQERLGQNLSPGDIKKFAALYNGMESQSSLRAQAANATNSQTAVVSPPSPTAAAENYIQTNMAPQQQAYGAVSRQQAFFNMLGAL